MVQKIVFIIYIVYEITRKRKEKKKVCRILNLMVPIYEFNLHYDSNDIIIYIDIDILANFYRKKK